MLLRGGIYNGHGFYLRDDNFVEKLPMFAASRYTDNCNGWKVMSMIMKSGDKATQYQHDVKSGKLDKFLCQTLIWTCLSHYPHMRSLYTKDNAVLLNELCFDDLRGKTTVAIKALDNYISKGYELTEEEVILFAKWKEILSQVSLTSEYNPQFNYGLYQIDEDINININIPQGVKSDGTPRMVTKYGDLNNLIKHMKSLLKTYYINNIVKPLFEYEFLK